MAAALGMGTIYLGLVTDDVSQEQGWQDGFWGRENTADPVIVHVVRRLIVDTFP